MEKNYLELYRDFLDGYKKGAIDAEHIGEVIAKMAQHYAMANIDLQKCDERVNTVYAKVVDQTDENTGKQIAVGKAEILAKDTEEYRDMAKAKVNIQNIEQYINALKAFQKGVLNEFSHMGGI